MTTWLDHVKHTRSLHPGKNYKQILTIAKQTYHRSSPAPRPSTPIPPDIDTDPDSEPDMEGGALIERRFNDQAQDILKNWGNAQITNITVRRAPVQAAVEKLLNIVSFGAYKKAVNDSPYDQMFHLSSILTLSKDNTTRNIILEKNEVVNMSFNIPTEKDTEVMNVTIPSPFKTLNEFIDTTLQRIGSGAFFLYDARNRNCQRFISDNLRSNGVLTPDVEAFVVQDADSIFKKMPKFVQHFARFVTDLGAAVSHVKDEVVDVAEDIAKGTRIAVKSTRKQIKKTGRRIRKAFGGAITDSHVIQTIIIPRSYGLAGARKWMRDNNVPMPHGHRLLRNTYRFQQLPPSDFDPDSFITYSLTEAPDIQVILGIKNNA